LSLVSLITLTYYYKPSFKITEIYFKLTDNILFFIYLFSLFSICLLTYFFLMKLENKGIPIDKTYLGIKRYVIIGMGINLFCYTFCLLMLSYYNPIIKIEQYLTSMLLVSKETNSIFFLFNFLLFIISLRYDLVYVHLNLQIRPDIEYFVDIEENMKTIL